MKKEFIKGLLFVTALTIATPVTTFAKEHEILASSDTKVISEKKLKNYPTGNFGRHAMKSLQDMEKKYIPKT